MIPALFLIFDFDGTLVDTVPDIAYHANAVLEQRRLGSRTVDEVQRGVGWGVHELFKSLTPGHSWADAELDEAVAEFKRLYGERPVIATRPYPGVREMLSGPLASLPKAILTNKPHALTVSILDRLDLTPYFREVLGQDHGFPAKPDPSGARHLMQAAKAKPEETVLIGDSHIDWHTARNAGTGFVWMDYGYDDRLKEEPAVERLSEAAGWRKFLEGQRFGRAC